MSPRLVEAVEAMRAEHDVILIDSPPLTAGVDALVLAAATTNLVVVLRSGTSELALTRAVLAAADAHPVRLVGAILNDVRDESEFRPYAYELGHYRSELLADSGERARPTILGGRP
jgi:succinoglycan biosynthesis transport protein ExoP